MGWLKLKLKLAMTLAEKIGARADEFGHLILTEKQFVDAMINGTAAAALTRLVRAKITILLFEPQFFSFFIFYLTKLIFFPSTFFLYLIILLI